MLFDLQKYRANTALLAETGRKVTYGEITETAGLLMQTIGSRNLVLLLSDNTIGALYMYVALMQSGNVVQLVPDDLGEGILSSYRNTFRPHYICGPAAFLNSSARVTDSVCGYSLERCDSTQAVQIYSELALLLPTSGSTGECKFVRLSYGNIRANTDSIIQYLQLQESERPILGLPISYAFGLSILHSHIAVGATILVPDSKFYQPVFWDFFRREQGTSFSGVPYSYEVLHKMRFFDLPLPSLRTLTQAGGRLSDELQHKYHSYAREHNKKFIIMYGQTEATARMTYLPFDAAGADEKIGSIGVPIPDTRISLTDESGKLITKPNQIGEIVFYGKNVSLGYAMTRGDLAKGDDNQGVLYTGDLACMDEDGYLYIKGRKSRFIKIVGKRVSLDEVEKILAGRYAGVESAVTGKDDSLIVHTTGDTTDDMKRYLCRILGIHRKFLQVHTIARIPRNRAGKIRYQLLSER